MKNGRNKLRQVPWTGVISACTVLAGAIASAEPYRDGDTVVFFGDSITHGGFYHTYVAAYYRTRFPDRTIRFVNSGIGGDSAAGAMRRISEDVTEYAPTHVVFHFGMNDIGREFYRATSDTASLMAREAAQAAYRENFTKLVSAVRRENAGAAFTYMTPSPYDDRMIDDHAAESLEGCNAGLSLMAGFVLSAAKKDKVFAVNVYSPLENCLVNTRKKIPSFRLTALDRVHPGIVGHSLMAWEFLNAQRVPALVSAVSVDAGSGGVSAVNADVGDVKVSAEGLSFSVLAKALPFPVPALAKGFLSECEVEAKLNDERLRVTGLDDGTDYRLTIDGEDVGTWRGAQLAMGIGLGFNERTPQYRQAQRVLRELEKLAGRERVLRNHHSARWYFGARGAPVDDMEAFGAWMKDFKGDAWSGYFGKFVPGYLSYWPNCRAEREKLWEDQQKAMELAKPCVRRYVLSPVCPLTTDARRLEARKAFSALKFGIFIHWGIYASFAQGEWYLEHAGLNEPEYAKAARSFNPQKFDARIWVKAFKAAGAKYVVFTTRHHDGFSMFDTKATDYDIVDATPFGQDVVKELADACRKEGLKLGFYYSLMDWHRPDYPTGREKQARASVAKGQEDYNSYFAFMKAQLTELLTNYGEILCIWLDGEWDHDPDDSNSKGFVVPTLDWRFGELYEHIHRLQPGCLILNNHHHAMREGEDIQGFERDAPGENKAGLSPGQKVQHEFPLETCDTMSDGAWGYQVGVTAYKSVEELRDLLRYANEKGANLLLNIGPRPDGRLPEQALERLGGMRK